MIIGELTWPQFKSLDSIRNLNENRQIEEYHKYLVFLSDSIRHQNKGPLLSNIIRCTDGMDIVFLVDYTGSMDSAINDVKTSIASIVEAIVAQSANNYRLGLVLFDEIQTENIEATYYPAKYFKRAAYTSLPSSQKYVNTGLVGPYGQVTQYITAMEVMSQNNQSSFSTQLNIINNPTNFPLGDGESLPEPSDMGLDRVVNYDLAGAFRDNVTKLVILITDNTSSGNDDTNNATDTAFAQTLIADCNSKGIKVLLMKPDSNSLEPLETIATETSGLISDSFTPSAIITAIENICIDV
jgi:hypothetical protein